LQLVFVPEQQQQGEIVNSFLFNAIVMKRVVAGLWIKWRNQLTNGHGRRSARFSMWRQRCSVVGFLHMNTDNAAAGRGGRERKRGVIRLCTFVY